MNFDVQENLGAIPSLLTREQLESIIRSSHVASLCQEIARGRTDLKRQLPAVCWQATFGGQKRANAHATPSGLFALDVDHLSQQQLSPQQLYDRLRDRIDDLGIYIVHTSPSGDGARIVAACRPELETLADNQAWLAQQLDVEHDACTHDLARLSFLVPESYFWHYNPAIFTDEPRSLPVVAQTAHYEKPQTAPARDDASSEPHGSDQGGAPSDGGSETTAEELCYHGVPYSRIVETLVERTGGEPQEGDRNNRLYLICRMLTNITDRQSHLIFRICPRFGLSEAEVKAVCESACKSARTNQLPAPLYKTLCELGIAGQGSMAGADPEQTCSRAEEDIQKALSIDHMPPIDHLPPLIREFVATAPDDFKIATAMACLPVCGFLGSRLRATYIDGELQAPSFIANIIAPAASGKSLLLRVPKICLEQVREADEEGRALEAEYQRQCKMNKNQKKQAEEPKPIIREIPAKISVAKLLKRVVQAQGLHLISVSAEVDTLTNSNNSGAWAQKSDIYRIAQDGDGGRYGQDYQSDASFSATCSIRYNLLTLGTPKAFDRAFPDVEDGLITRCIMVEIAPQFGKPMPEPKFLTKTQERTIQSKVAVLMAVSQDELGTVLPVHTLQLQWLNEGLSKWLEDQRLQSVRDDDHARDQFRRRAALIGFRAGMVASFLWGRLSKERRAYTIEFACWVADHILHTLLRRYGGAVNEEALAYETARPTRYASLFDAIPDVFTEKQLHKASLALGVHSPIKTVVHRWKDNGLIEKQGDTFVKLCK